MKILMINFAKNIIKSGLIKSHALQLLNRLTHKRIAILRYHSVQDDPECLDDSVGAHITHATHVFREQMEIISRNYNPISLDDLLAFLMHEKDLGDNSVVVTFDDGFKDNFDLAVPILNFYGINATFYLTVQAIEERCVPFFIRVRKAIWTSPKPFWQDPGNGKKLNLGSREGKVALLQATSNRCAQLCGDRLEKEVRELEADLGVECKPDQAALMMDWQDVGKLIKEGHMIGSHTLTHPNLAYLNPEDQKKEIFDSKKIIEEKTNIKIIHFSYPNPGLSPQLNQYTTDLLTQAGYETAVTSSAGSVSATSNRFLLKRAFVPDNVEEFLWHLNWTLIGRAL
jgi:peptidoglycan/xylan/chitin deacetylase (PgdA/CDA1 family)